MNTLLIIAVTVISGLYTSLWGAFKDSPYEGLKRRTFWRSILFSLLALGVLAAVPGLREGLPELYLVQLFFLIMGIERTISEIYKGFFRDEDQTKYLVPSRISFFGRRIRRERYRYGAGLVLSLGALAILNTSETVSHWAVFVMVCLAAGVVCAVGGAYKDAPFEGFELRKFPRSLLVITLCAPLLFLFGPVRLGYLFYISVGAERFIVEYYKTYAQRRKAGKFRDDLPRIQHYLEARERFHIAALFIVFTVGILAFNAFA